MDRFITQTLEKAQAAGRRRDRSWAAAGRSSGSRTTTGRSRNLAERTAINTVIQGSAADLIKRGDDQDRQSCSASVGLKSRMVLQIHDELVFEAPADEVRGLADLVADEMTTALDLSVPLQVDLAAGPNWLDVESIESPC